MEYYIEAQSKGKPLMGTQNGTIIHDAKSMVKLNNALKSFNPEKRADEIKVFSFTNFYNTDTFKLIQTIKL